MNAVVHRSRSSRFLEDGSGQRCCRALDLHAGVRRRLLLRGKHLGPRAARSPAQCGVGREIHPHQASRPVKLVWALEFERVDEAFTFEKQVQGWSRAKRQALIEGRWEDLPTLALRRNRSTFEMWEAEEAQARGE